MWANGEQLSEFRRNAPEGAYIGPMRFEAPLPAIGDRILWAGRKLRVRSVAADPRTPDQLTLNTEEER